MLKNKFAILLILILIILISTVSFADDSLSISNWIVQSTLLENGDLTISEDITFEFQDSFNGVFRNIVLEKTDGISDIELYEIIEGSMGEEEVIYSLNNDAKKGDTKVFKSEVKNNTNEIMIFSPSNNESKTFRIKYTLYDVAIKHGDTGELYYKFLGDENDTRIKHFSATIDLPSIDRENTKIFAHGPSNGRIDFVEDNSIKLEVRSVSPNTFVEARVLFPKDFILSSTNQGSKTLNKIVDEEISFTNKIQEDLDYKLKMKDLFGNISLIAAALGTLLISFILNKLRRSTDIFNAYSSLSPEDISPGELRLFVSQVNDSRSLMSTIFDLARRGYVTIDLGKELKKNRNEFIITNNNKSQNDLLSHEIYLLDWLFNTIGNGSILSTEDIESYRKGSYMRFNKELTLWQSKIKSGLKNRGYYDDSTKSTGIMLIFVSLALFIIFILSLVNENFYGFLPMVLATFTFIYGISLLVRKSDLGYIQYKMWKDYKTDLERQGKTPDTYNEIILKDRDLINGLALGLPMKSMNNFRDTLPQASMNSHWMYWYFLGNSKGGSRFEDSFNSSFYGYSGSSTSTSIGGGGGFSGGGGGGGGGAGGGGAGGF